jgi:hypothetical protein
MMLGDEVVIAQQDLVARLDEWANSVVSICWVHQHRYNDIS